LRKKIVRRYNELRKSKNSISSQTQLPAKELNYEKFVDSSKLIDKNDKERMNFIHQALNMPSRLELLFRASEHYFEAHKFHQVCDGIPHTFSVIRTQYGKTLAGYTPVSWNAAPSGQHAEDPTQSSCILSLDLMVKMRLAKPEYAIYCYTGFGPRFGGGADMHISNQCDENASSYLEYPSSYISS
jgi:hypothetical protein